MTSSDGLVVSECGRETHRYRVRFRLPTKCFLLHFYDKKSGVAVLMYFGGYLGLKATVK